MSEDFERFIKKMKEGIALHDGVYGDSWKNQEIIQLENKLLTKYNEYKLTRSPNKLISMANFAMLLYLRRLEELKQELK